MQGTWVPALVWEDPTCRGATKPVCHNYWACTLEPASHNYWVHMPQLLKPARLEPVLCNEKPPQWEARSPQLEKACAQQRRPEAAKNKINKINKLKKRKRREVCIMKNFNWSWRQKLVWAKYDQLLRLPLEGGKKSLLLWQVAGVLAESLEYLWFGPVQRTCVRSTLKPLDIGDSILFHISQGPSDMVSTYVFSLTILQYHSTLQRYSCMKGLSSRTELFLHHLLM